VDILVDMNGYTLGTRLLIFALRPAPLQLAWLGYPSTTGAAFIDAIVLDEVIAGPPRSPLEQLYTEKHILSMPGAYALNSYAERYPPPQAITGALGAAAGAGAKGSKAERVFVFANLNRLSKLDAPSLACWLRILKRVPHSVLWLLAAPQEGVAMVRGTTHNATLLIDACACRCNTR
jgi:protein O-GlcNAc transferase